MSDERVSRLVRTFAPKFGEFVETEEMELYYDLIPLLAEGRPVPVERVAAEVGRPRQEVAEAIRGLPNIEYDEAGRVVGAGLTLNETRHRFRLGDRLLYTWCAWDAVIYPPIIDRTAEVESTCPATGEAIHMTVTPGGVEGLDPGRAVLTFPDPDLERACHDIRAEFCDRSNFYRSAEAAREHLSGRDEAEILSVEEGFELGVRLHSEEGLSTAEAAG